MLHPKQTYINIFFLPYALFCLPQKMENSYESFNDFLLAEQFRFIEIYICTYLPLYTSGWRVGIVIEGSLVRREFEYRQRPSYVSLIKKHHPQFFVLVLTSKKVIL